MEGVHFHGNAKFNVLYVNSQLVSVFGFPLSHKNRFSVCRGRTLDMRRFSATHRKMMMIFIILHPPPHDDVFCHPPSPTSHGGSFRPIIGYILYIIRFWAIFEPFLGYFLVYYRLKMGF